MCSLTKSKSPSKYNKEIETDTSLIFNVDKAQVKVIDANFLVNMIQFVKGGIHANFYIVVPKVPVNQLISNF